MTVVIHDYKISGVMDFFLIWFYYFFWNGNFCFEMVMVDE